MISDLIAIASQFDDSFFELSPRSGKVASDWSIVLTMMNDSWTQPQQFSMQAWGMFRIFEIPVTLISLSRDNTQLEY